MARYIDADVLKRNIRINLMPNVDVDGTVTVENAERYFLNLIDKSSTADVAEIVRCKECRHRRETANRSYCLPVFGLKQITDLDAFCSYGERRMDNVM